VADTPRTSAREQLREFRRVVSDAVGELRSAEIRDSYVSLSLEELVDQNIERLEGGTDPTSPSRLERVRKIREELSSKIDAMKDTPPEFFRRADAEGDVNTPPGDDQ
jgi:uncharacterized protein YdcH (DUF465 family)